MKTHEVTVVYTAAAGTAAAVDALHTIIMINQAAGAFHKAAISCQKARYRWVDRLLRVLCLPGVTVSPRHSKLPLSGLQPTPLLQFCTWLGPV